MITLVLAMNKKRTIGLNGVMPWRNAEDLKFFRRLTMNQEIVMGRKTVEGLPKTLDGRHIHTVTRNPEIKQSIQDFEQYLIDHQDTKEQILILGGGEIYKQALPYAHKIYLSVIDDETVGDTFFPELDPKAFRRTEKIPFETFVLEIYERITV